MRSEACAAKQTDMQTMMLQPIPLKKTGHQLGRSEAGCAVSIHASFHASSFKGPSSSNSRLCQPGVIARASAVFTIKLWIALELTRAT